MDASSETWPAVWRLYLEHREVFARVFGHLRSKGWRLFDGLEDDLVHDFLLRGAARVLTRFDATRGNLPGLLSMAFRNFLLSEARGVRHRERLLATYAMAVNDMTDEIRLLNLPDTSVKLPLAEREALDAFLEGGSIRAAAQQLNLSRWTLNKRVASAIERVHRSVRRSERDEK